MKRTFDIAASLVGLILLAPIFAAVALLLKLSGRGPVFFVQERVGRNFRPFRIYKFRTMVVGAEGMGPGVTASGDPRVTRLGRILRKTKVDELPQLFNVLRGDMSLVGPRPELPQYVSLFQEEYAEILTVRPGITDLASITYRDESPLLAESLDPEEQYVRVILPEKLRLAMEYVARSSFLYDLKLIFMTIVTLAYPGKSIDRSFNSLAAHRYPVAAIVQSALLILAQYGAFLILYDGRIPEKEFRLFLTTAPIILAIRLLLFYPFRLYRGLWRYVSIQDLQSIALSLTLSSAAWWALSRAITPFSSYPRPVILIDLILSLTLLGGIRLVRRIHRELGGSSSRTRRVLVVGSGDAAERIMRGLLAAGRGEYRIVGLIDNDPKSRGAWIHNAPVLGGIDDLEGAIRRENPDEVLIAFSSTPEADRRAVLRQCKKFHKPAKFIPDLPEILAGKDLHSLVQEFEPDDLLFREPIQIDLGAVTGFYTSRRILITGAGGSIGSEISRQVASCRPRVLVLYEKHEESLYMIDKELRGTYPELQIESVIGDVMDEERVRGVLKKTSPHAIFHAAAYKHVPMMERNPIEAFKTNVLGTKMMSDLAGEYGTEVFVLISTDKAVEPLSVMGRTKRVAELLLQGLNGARATKYLTVRFGNVLESSGSVIPLFKEQIERGGPVTVTHPEVTRLFMTIPEAVQLILQAAPMGDGGEIFVLDMGKPIRIVDLAKALIRLYGLTPNQDIEVVFTGLRPGERLFEKLVNDHEKIWKTTHPKILKAVSEGTKRRGREEIAELMATIEIGVNGDGTGRAFESAKEMLLSESAAPRTQQAEPRPARTTEAGARHGASGAVRARE